MTTSVTLLFRGTKPGNKQLVQPPGHGVHIVQATIHAVAAAVGRDTRVTAIEIVVRRKDAPAGRPSSEDTGGTISVEKAIGGCAGTATEEPVVVGLRAGQGGLAGLQTLLDGVEVVAVPPAASVHELPAHALRGVEEVARQVSAAVARQRRFPAPVCPRQRRDCTEKG